MRNFNPFVTVTPGHYGRVHPFALFHNPPDAGGAEGGAGGGAEGAADGGGADGGAEGAIGAEGGTGGAKLHKFDSEDYLVQMPGFDKPVKLSDLRSGYQTRERHDASLKVMGEIAKAIQGQRARQPERKQTEEQPRRRAADKADPFSDLEKMDVLEGKALAPVLRQLQGAGEPIQKLVVALAKEVQDLKKWRGGQVQERTETEYNGEISKAVQGMKLPKAEGEDAAMELARTFFQSYAPEDQPRLKGETFSKEFKTFFTSVRKYFRNLEKAEVTAAQERARFKFTRPGAGSSANGQGGKHLSNRQLADILHDGIAPES